MMLFKKYRNLFTWMEAKGQITPFRPALYIYSFSLVGVGVAGRDGLGALLLLEILRGLKMRTEGSLFSFQI
jgi:hypothetical protein